MFIKPIFAIIMVLIISGCSGGGGGDGDKYLGEWQSKKYGMTISKDGQMFIVDVRITSGWQGLQGKHAAKLVDGSLNFDTQILGQANLSDDGTKIYWAGDEWLKQ